MFVVVTRGGDLGVKGAVTRKGLRTTVVNKCCSFVIFYENMSDHERILSTLVGYKSRLVTGNASWSSKIYLRKLFVADIKRGR